MSQPNIFTGDWILDCDKWRGRLLTGGAAHWCPEWDDLPVDETCFEWPCRCSFADAWGEDAMLGVQA